MSIVWKDRTNEKTDKIPINNDLPITDNLKIVADWIKTNNQKYIPCYAIMYHAAKKSASILEQGLLSGCTKRKNFSVSENGYVYLATTPNMAKFFGDIAHNSDCAIYEVIVPIRKLLPDNTRLKFANIDSSTSKGVSASLVYAGSARFKGDIERWQIKEYKEEKQSLLENLEQKKQLAKKHLIPSATYKSVKERG